MMKHQNHFICSVKGNVNAKNAINLLYYYTNPTNGYFIWMKHPTRVFARITKHKEKKYICTRCYDVHPSREAIAAYEKFCEGGSCQIKEFKL